MTLTEFLAARLDEDEVAAKAALPAGWMALDGGVMSEDETWPVASTEVDNDRAVRVHIARHDPARVLREVAVKRWLLASYETQDGYDLPPGVSEGRDDDERECDQALRDLLQNIVANLAAVWDDHPDYDEAWRS